MKKVIFALFCFAFLGFSQTSTAQIDATISPLGLLFGGDISLSADFAVQENFSINVRSGYGNTDWTIGGSGFEVDAVPLTVAGRYYFNPKRGADGFAVDIFLRHVYRNMTAGAGSNNADAVWNRGGLGFGISYKAVSKGNFVFDIGTGVGRSIWDSVNYGTEGNQEDFSAKWLPLAYARIGIGYRFGGSKGQQ